MNVTHPHWGKSFDAALEAKYGAPSHRKIFRELAGIPKGTLDTWCAKAEMPHINKKYHAAILKELGMKDLHELRQIHLAQAGLLAPTLRDLAVYRATDLVRELLRREVGGEITEQLALVVLREEAGELEQEWDGPNSGTSTQRRGYRKA